MPLLSPQEVTARHLLVKEGLTLPNLTQGSYLFRSEAKG